MFPASTDSRHRKQVFWHTKSVCSVQCSAFRETTLNFVGILLLDFWCYGSIMPSRKNETIKMLARNWNTCKSDANFRGIVYTFEVEPYANLDKAKMKQWTTSSFFHKTLRVHFSARWTQTISLRFSVTGVRSLALGSATMKVLMPRNTNMGKPHINLKHVSYAGFFESFSQMKASSRPSYCPIVHAEKRWIGLVYPFFIPARKVRWSKKPARPPLFGTPQHPA